MLPLEIISERASWASSISLNLSFKVQVVPNSSNSGCLLAWLVFGISKKVSGFIKFVVEDEHALWQNDVGRSCSWAPLIWNSLI